MHLKTLTVRGFKSFASATTFHFEPGVTAVVGPNGSGKSNVVDALSWVMGEQGAKSLRGGTMEDVIFAGTSGRSALGRAHVSLTIDNADGALPIEYSEVTISRTLFRTGGSEYAINGRSCRLLDIQELLSDSGLGREMHVIVGQGQLDRVLQATPEDRRGFIEEASGILKHRRRKEKTLRKLDSLQANLDRLEDLVGEIQRQLTPLGRQARTARKAQRIQYDVRDATSRLLADDLEQARAALQTDSAASAATRAEKLRLEQLEEHSAARLRETEAHAARTAPVLNAARSSWYELSTVRDQFRALSSLAGERRTLLGSAEPEPDTGKDASRLEEQAERSRAEAAGLHERVAESRARLASVEAARHEAEETARVAEQRTAHLVREAADRRAGQAKLAAAVSSARSGLTSAEADIERLRVEINDVTARSEGARGDHAQLSERAENLRTAAARSAELADHARETTDQVETAARQAEAERQRVLREQHSVTVRLDTLQQSMPQPDGSRAVSASHGESVLGAVSDALRVAEGWERAVGAALGPWSEALAVGSHARAADIFASLRTEDSGRVNVLVASGHDAAGEPPEVTLPEGAVRAVSVLSGATRASKDSTAQAILTAVRGLLATTILVPDAHTAVAVLDAAAASKATGLRAVTANGDVFGTHQAQGGAAEAAGSLEIHAQIDKARSEAARWSRDAATASAAAQDAEARRIEATAKTREAEGLARDQQRAATDAANALGRAEAVLASANAELQRRREALATAEQRLGECEAHLQDAVARAEAVTSGDEETLERHQLEAASAKDRAERAAREAREAETQARLALRGLEEQYRSADSRATSQARAAQAERVAQAEAARRAERRRVQATIAQAVSHAADHLRLRAEESVTEAARVRDAADVQRAGLDEAAGRLRAERENLGKQLNTVTEQLHREELELAQRQARLEALEKSSLEGLGMTPDYLVDHYGPHLPVPDAEAVLEAAQDAEERDETQDVTRIPAMTDPGAPFRRDEQETRLRRAEKQLRALGKVNPLALEEFAALEERHSFLVEQLEDVKNSRADLRNIIRQVDEHVERVFTEAYQDTAEQFVRVFATLFPGGEGQLRLTDPDDMLTTGVDVEARPAGKKIKRLSLLSGGERSLTALALLVAIFKARPSPFYVMDEVEAALDDRNLGRLLSIFQQLQESSQLIIVTHQKRTMEIADALYGVSMRGDGVSLVVGQKLTELR